MFILIILILIFLFVGIFDLCVLLFIRRLDLFLYVMNSRLLGSFFFLVVESESVVELNLFDNLMWLFFLSLRWVIFFGDIWIVLIWC